MINRISKPLKLPLSSTPQLADDAPANADVSTRQSTINTISTVSNQDYVQLKRLIREQGLLEKQPVYATYKIILTLGLLILGLIFLFLINNTWLLLLGAAYFAFTFTQIGFIAHDVGHRQVFYGAWKNDVIGYIAGNFLLGLSYCWWVDKHNQHHSHPNELDLDPDIDIPLLAFSEGQALNKPRWLRPIIKYQAYLFFPMLLLGAFSIRGASLRFLLQKKSKRPLLEISLISLHFILYFSIVFYLLGGWLAVVFILLHQALFGLYNTSVFAPNHKGMLMLEPDFKLDFLRQQVLTARNVKASPVVDFWYGGLNYQIEHHLFPNMPRNKLRDAQKIVQAFCAEHHIDYYETGVIQSYWEILESLHEVSAPLRRNNL